MRMVTNAPKKVLPRNLIVKREVGLTFVVFFYNWDDVLHETAEKRL